MRLRIDLSRTRRNAHRSMNIMALVYGWWRLFWLRGCYCILKSRLKEKNIQKEQWSGRAFWCFSDAFLQKRSQFRNEAYSHSNSVRGKVCMSVGTYVPLEVSKKNIWLYNYMYGVCVWVCVWINGGCERQLWNFKWAEKANGKIITTQKFLFTPALAFLLFFFAPLPSTRDNFRYAEISICTEQAHTHWLEKNTQAVVWVGVGSLTWQNPTTFGEFKKETNSKPAENVA